MKTTEAIVIELPSDVAQAYLKANLEEKEKIDTRIAFLIKSASLGEAEALAKFQQTMDEIGQKASERGLTPEILESILCDDE